MSDKLEELRARMRAVWDRVDGVEVREPARVVCLKTRKSFDPPPAPVEEIAQLEPVVNRLLVEELDMLLQRAENGEISSITYAACDARTGGFETHAIMAIDTDEHESQHALRHIGALEMVKEYLLDLAHGMEPLEDELNDLFDGDDE